MFSTNLAASNEGPQNLLIAYPDPMTKVNVFLNNLSVFLSMADQEPLYPIHPEIEHFLKGVTNDEFVIRNS